MAVPSSSSNKAHEIKYKLPKFPEQRNRHIFLPIKGFRPDRQPVWIMGQASEYLPEFRQMCQKYGYYELLHNPKLICEVTLLPIKRFQFDAAIIFSDILLLVEALGLRVTFGSESIIPEPVDVENMNYLKFEGFIDRLKYIDEAITLTRHKLRGSAALFGFAGAPWTLMSYIIEGKSSSACVKAKSWLYAHKQKARQMIEVLAFVVTDFCIMQAKAGAQVIQIFDTNAEHLSRDIYAEFFLPSLRSIRKKVQSALKICDLEVPMVIYAKGCAHSIVDLVNAGYDVIGLDSSVVACNVTSALLPKKICLQGNLDPCKLYAPAQKVYTLTQNMLRKFRGTKSITNLGDTILPDTPLESVQAFVDAVRSFNEPREGYSESDESVPNSPSRMSVTSVNNV